jgi:predicted dehydrogenase
LAETIVSKILETVRWGIIGCGNVTELKSGPAFSKVANSRLVAVMRRDARLAEDYARRHGVPRWYAQADALIGDDEVNAVYVATPPHLHKDYVIRCAEAGKPVYVEKPMALNARECDEMLAACRANDVPLFVAYYRRCLPRFLKIRELLEVERVIGTPRFVTCTLYRPLDASLRNPGALPWRVLPEIAGGGLFVDLASHSIDMLDFLFGKIVSVRGHASSQAGAYPAEDAVSMSLLFADGMHGVGMWNFASHARHDEIQVVGSEGRLSFATFGDGGIVLERFGEPAQHYSISNPEHIQQPLIERIVRVLTGVEAAPDELDPARAASASWVMDQVLDEYRAQASQGNHTS